MPTTSPPILIYQPGGGVPIGPASNPPVYSQKGTTQLVAGQAYIDVVFGSVQTDDEWVLSECIVVNELDVAPLNIWPGIITDKAASGFRLQLNGMPDSSNYYLHWAVSGVNITPTPATTFTMTGPTSGFVGVPLTFTVSLPASTTGTATITPSDSGGGGVFSPTSVTLTTGVPSTTFTYTPGSAGSKTISVTNNGGLLNPSSIVVTVVNTATGYSFAGPSTGGVGLASTPFTVTLTPAGYAVPVPVTITPSDGGGGGTFTPSTVNLTTVAPSATFTYTAASVGAKTLSVTNSGGLTNPGNLTYTAAVVPHLLNTLISYWKLDETSAGSAPVTRVDSFGTNHLTDHGNTPQATGKINNAAGFSGTQWLSCASNASLQMASNTDFTISCWVYRLSEVDEMYVTKDDSAANSRDYTLSYQTTIGGMFYIKGGSTYIVTTGVGSETLNTWYHLVAWYDSSNGQLHLRVNDTTTYDSVTGATGTDVSAAEFRIGARQYAGAEGYASARIDEVGIWKRKLTSVEITALYNGGAGLPFSSFTT